MLCVTKAKTMGKTCRQFTSYELIAAFGSIPAHEKCTQVVMRRRKDKPRNLELETGITAN